MTTMPLKPVLTVMIGALAAYSGFWYYMSQNAEDYLRDKAKVWLLSGLDLDFDQAEVTGFPYRIVITLSGPKITYTNGEVVLQALPDDLSIVVQPWQLEHALFFASQGTLRLAKDRRLKKAESYEFSALSASARVQEAQLSNLSIELEELRLETRNQEIALTSVQFHWRVAEPAAGSDSGLLEPPIAEIAFTVGRMRALGKAESKSIFENMTIELTPRGPGHFRFTGSDLVRWRDEGGTLEIDALRAGWPGGSVAASGSFTLDEEMRPLGLMSLDVTDAQAFASRLGSTGLFEDPTIAALQDGLRPVAGQSDSKALRFSLSWQTGNVYLDAHKIAALEPIFDE